jgi:hypothetical protein
MDTDIQEVYEYGMLWVTMVKDVKIKTQKFQHLNKICHFCQTL